MTVHNRGYADNELLQRFIDNLEADEEYKEELRTIDEDKIKKVHIEEELLEMRKQIEELKEKIK